MMFTTFSFVAFFLVVFVAGWTLVSRPRAWRWFMAAASYFFYSFWGWEFACLLAAYTLVAYGLAAALGAVKKGRRWVFTGGVFLLLMPLLLFKYYGFLVIEIGKWEGGNAFFGSLAGLAVPVGLSFTTFRGLSHLIDSYRRQSLRPTFDEFVLYMSFFPYLAAGPIVRTRELLPQLRTGLAQSRVDSSRALYLIVLGLTKKVVLGDFLARAIVDGVFAAPGHYSSLDVVVGIHAYAVQIYCDFSGYSDMAIGIALLLGVALPPNFDRPYIARSVREFWRRWHMTLSAWLRDYLYIPLGGSWGSQWATYRNVLITMVLAGLWHGAGWTFIVWGLLHGLAQAAERALLHWRERKGLAAISTGSWWRFLERAVTLEFVCLTWVFFRAESLGAAFRVIGRTFTAWNVVPSVSGLVVAAVVLGIGCQYVPQAVSERLQIWLSRRAPVVQGVIFGLVVFAVIGLLGTEGVTRFVYFGF